MRKSYSIPLILLLVAAKPAVAEVWQVTEGTQKASRGTWTVNAIGSELNGTAEMTDDQGRRVTFKLTGTIKGSQYALQRVSPSNGANCVYRGDMNQPGKISGSAICGPNQTAWFVQRQ